MYSCLKYILRLAIPEKYFVKYEGEFRALLYPFYKGKICRCNICDAELRIFIKLKSGDLLCPKCGSLGRTRRLYKLLNEYIFKEGPQVLDFSPSRSLYRKLKSKKEICYYPTDFENEFLADYHFDITNIEIGNNFFDVVICYHILEHIEDDQTAIKELYRVLKPGGKLLVQTPFKEGDIYENPLITSTTDRLKHFGQEDHVRVYSPQGLAKRLSRSGFSVKTEKYSPDVELGLSENEIVLIATK